jgi:uncharacterized protein (TIRG00374 family)
LALSPKLIRQFLIWLVIGIAVYGIAVAYGDVDKMGATLARVGWFGWAAVIGLSSLNIVVRFIRWQMYLKALGHAVPIGRSLAYFVAGFAFTSTPAKAGEALRSLYLKRENVNYTESLGALFVERLTDLIAVVLFALAAAYMFADYRWFVFVAGALVLSFLPLVHSEFLRTLLTSIADRLPAGRLQSGLHHLVDLIKSSAALLRSGPLYGGMALSLIAALCVCLMMYLVLMLLGAEISLPLAVGIYATGILVGALSFLPGGIGSAELVMIGLLILAGIDQTTATAATLVCRVAALWYSIALGIAIVLRLEFGSQPATEER